MLISICVGFSKLRGTAKTQKIKMGLQRNLKQQPSAPQDRSATMVDEEMYVKVLLDK